MGHVSKIFGSIWLAAVLGICSLSSLNAAPDRVRVINGDAPAGICSAINSILYFYFEDDGSIDACRCNSGTWSCGDLQGAPGADHIDALTEVAQSIKSGANDTETLIIGTPGSNNQCALWTASGTLDGAACSSATPLSTGAGTIYATTTTDNFAVGNGAPGAKLDIDGDASEIQLLIQAHSTQSADIVRILDSAATVIYKIQDNGIIRLQAINDIDGVWDITAAGVATFTSVTVTDPPNAGIQLFGTDAPAAATYTSRWRAGRAVTAMEIWCESDSDATINLQLDDGTPANMCTGTLTCTSTGATCTLSAETAIADGDRIDVVVVDASASTQLSVILEVE